jgi:molybdenum cofactor cytidylyltransferase
MTLRDSIAVVILAAGNSSRMGSPKLRMKIGNELFLGKILTGLRAAGLTDCACILRGSESQWLAEQFPSLTAIVNPEPERGMLSSVQRGISYYSDKDGVMIMPVDHPLVETVTYKMIVDAWRNDRSAVVVPSWNRRAGHPIVIPRRLFSDISQAPDGTRLNDLLRSATEKLLYLSCQDAGIVRNINSPEDLLPSGNKFAD